MSEETTLIESLYALFNSRDIEGVLRSLHPDVVWANGMEGGHVHGHEGLRSYWTRQWQAVNPHVLPVTVSTGPSGEIVVTVHQLVHDLQGNVLEDKLVTHIFRVENGLVTRFDIADPRTSGL